MPLRAINSGLSPALPTAPPASGGVTARLTEEAALIPLRSERLRLDMLCEEGALLAQGAPVARMRDHPEVALVAPMAARLARVRLGPGRQLIELLFFHEPEAGRHVFEVAAARHGDAAAIRVLMQQAGLWRLLRSRPFGRMPAVAESPAAIFVMAADTRPHAPDPVAMLEGRGESFSRGLAALGRLTGGPVFLCQPRGPALAGPGAVEGRLRILRCGNRHPQGLAGFRIHHEHPATPEAPVWELHAEDVADLGALLETGSLPGLRSVSVTGEALTETRLLRCQPGANLRGLCQGAVVPGWHQVLSGSALDGHEATWLGLRDRQVTVQDSHRGSPRSHWFSNALRRAARPLPVIPTAALEQAFGTALPAMALIRALSSGDDESFTRLGGLSLLEEDLALADYVTGATPRLSALLRAALDRIAAEEGL
ncbi:Na+-transporting NADH:ubiquinone oxidoreductase subunit A [Pseudooceanicola antarcticus]|uniref:Na(+)-translocating NADH-quinone reductase subunit A n=1 Tax=Pseudooceanicola antarcticus TaxID=1247613 RepID=A0A285J0Z9_9RHOB|nr:Na(+)-translocating NADH-quinone reductase subunit A [Pseudooceanicola antarcticus]SNY53979.1 Na+-transporting NADH:ubiquinone oxidoreductase subunit A [Pseudooceanicola antarcticus]